MTDYILVRQRDLKDVVHTRVIPSAECYTDHSLVRCKFGFHFKPKPRIGCAPPKKCFLMDFQKNIRCWIISWKNQTAHQIRLHIKTAILQASNETLGFSAKKNKDWFDENNEEIQKMLATKRSTQQAHLAQASGPQKKAAFRLAFSTLQCKLRNIQNEWWANLAERTQYCAVTDDYRALTAVYGPSYQTKSPLRSADGKELLTENGSIINRWLEHFHALFNVCHTDQQSANDGIPQQPVQTELDKTPTLQETLTALEQLKCGKAAGIDGTPPENWKNVGPALNIKLNEFFVCCWEQGKLPQDLRDAVIITLYNNKGKSLTAQTIAG